MILESIPEGDPRRPLLSVDRRKTSSSAIGGSATYDNFGSELIRDSGPAGLVLVD